MGMGLMRQKQPMVAWLRLVTMVDAADWPMPLQLVLLADWQIGAQALAPIGQPPGTAAIGWLHTGERPSDWLFFLRTIPFTHRSL